MSDQPGAKRAAWRGRGPSEQADRLSVTDVKKSFGATRALDGVTLTVPSARVHALVGENGAGKSTLLAILSGVVRQDAGSITLDGAPYAPSRPADAHRAGVATVYQELSLCPHLSVAENLFLGGLPARWGVVDRRVLHERAAAALDRVGARRHAKVEPDRLVGELPLFARQLVEIARALARPGARVLLLDEPTSSLSAGDVDRLFETVATLREEGLTIVYISHFLEEVRTVAESFTVLRDGRTVTSGRLEDVTNADLIDAMAGRTGVAAGGTSARPPAARTDRSAGDIVLSIEGVAGHLLPADASLELRRGEVLGIAGLVGAGRTELLRVVFGLDAIAKGTVRVGAWLGRDAGAPPARVSPADRWAEGVGLLSEDRKGEGLALGMSIADNMTLSRLSGFGPPGLVLPAAQARAARTWIDRLAIRCAGPDQPVGELSGGNQQKVALARLLQHDVDVLLLDEPTRGIDVGSKAEIHRQIGALAAAGKAIILVSSYLPELFAVCDRIAVMRRGRLGPARPASDLDARQLLSEATGA